MQHHAQDAVDAEPGVPEAVAAPGGGRLEARDSQGFDVHQDIQMLWLDAAVDPTPPPADERGSHGGKSGAMQGSRGIKYF